LKNNALINIGTGGSSFDATGSLKINGFLEVGNAGNTFFLVEGGSGNTSIAGNLFVGPISSERFFVEGATGTTKIGPAGAEVFSVDGDDGDIHTTRRYFDSSGQPGTADQVLSATGSGTLWIDAPTPIINTALNMNSHAITNIGSGGSSFSGSGDLNLNNNLITNIGPPGSGFAPNGLLIMKADIQVGRTAPLAVINAENGGAGFKGALTVGNVGGIPPFIVNDQGDLATDGNAHVKGQYRDSTDPLGLPGEPGQFLSSTGVGTRWRDLIVAPLDMKSFAITNIGSGGASFSGAGGLNLKGDLDLGMNGITGIGTANSFFFPDGSLTVRPVLTVQDAQGQTTLSSSGSLTSSMVDFVVGPAQFSVDADTGDTLISGSLFVANEFRDSGNFPGAANQILASTGAGTQWVNPPGSGGSGNFSEIAVTGNTGLGDDENDTTTVTGDATFSRDLTIGRNADIQRDLVVAGDSHLNGSVFDSAGLPGDADQFLSSTGTGTLWRDLIVGPLDMKNNAITNIGGGGSSFGGDGSLNVIGNLNVGSGNFTVNGTTGDASSQRDMAAGRDLLVSGDSHINGSYFDSPGLPGDPGQILSSTGSGTLWIDPPSGGGGTNCVCVDFEVPGAMTVDSSSASFTVPLNAQGPFNFITNVVTDLIQVSPPTNPFSPVVQVTATSDFAPMARFHNFLGTAPAVQIQGTTEMNGNATINGDLFVSGAIINPSDARLKHNVAPIDDALAIVARLRGVRFDWRRYEFPDRRFPETRQVGFIAQELKDALPEVVSEDKDGFQAVDYAKVTAVLAEAVKELDAKLAKRESQFQELSARLERIESVLGAGAPAAVAAVPADRTGK
jgi:hypothetical protein